MKSSAETSVSVTEVTLQMRILIADAQDVIFDLQLAPANVKDWENQRASTLRNQKLGKIWR